MTSSIRSINRTSNYIGVGNDLIKLNNYTIDVELDDLKIYNRALNPYEISLDMNSFTQNDYLPILYSLTNHWSFNTELIDRIRRNDLKNPINIVFTKDRLTSDLSSVYLNNGYLNTYLNNDLMSLLIVTLTIN